MAEHGLFMGWNRPIPGRETEASEVFEQSLAYWGKLQQEGQIEAFEPVLLAQHGGDLNGFFLIRGEKAKLDALMDTEDYVKLAMRIDHIVSGFGVVPVVLGDKLGQYMGLWNEIIAE